MNQVVRALATGAAALMGSSILPASAADQPEVRVVRQPSVETASGLYTPNRAPLQATVFLKLPTGAITPSGWLRRQLELDAEGIPGKYAEVSDYLRFAGNGWVDPNGKAGWEELTYWLKGYGDLGYVLRDDRITADAKKWIDGILTSQRDDGWFGPSSARTSLDGGPDLWPHMPALNALQSYYEFTGDERVISFLTKYFKFQDTLPVAVFHRGWGAVRWGDNIESIYWLYNRTGDAWLLGLVKKIHENSADYTNTIPTWHNVNLAQGFREPAEYWLEAKDDKFLQATEKDYETIMNRYGQFAGGGFAGDENCRPAYHDPRQGFETCGMVEFMHSFEMLTRISGNPLWADRCEEIAFNSLPAALSPDHKGIHYITSPNSIELDVAGKRHGQFGNGAMPMQAYEPGVHNYRCCPHNYGMGWPYYSENSWLATADNGLCASLYTASEVKAKVADGSEVKITEETDYPFADTIHLKVSSPKNVSFPLYLRVPRWCKTPAVKINGNAAQVQADPLTYIVVQREWADGDTVDLQLPMNVAVRTWTKNNNSVSVDYGPLSFSLDIGEKWNKTGGTDAWPQFEVIPTTAWNYGLEFDPQNPAASFEIVRKPGPVAEQPFTHEGAPLSLRARARKIPGWQVDADKVVGVLKPSPARSTEPEETVSLIPMGAARLRITSFPTIGTGDDAHDWAVATGGPKPSASYCNGGDTVDALNSGNDPANSDDESIPRLTWWDHKGTSEWAQYDFDKPATFSAVSVYWFDDTGHGACRVPASWKLLCKDGDTWKPVDGASDYGVVVNKYNRVTFTPAATSALRVQVQLQDNVSGGILQWRFEQK